jgi:tRNA(fMet)-specific endonuclease VapC
MVCADTTFLADLLRKNPEADKKLIELKGKSNKISTTVITSAELFYGAYKSNNVEREKAKVKFILTHFIVYKMDEKSSEKFGEILNILEKNGQKIFDKDLLIAAIALFNGENTIVTRNVKDFERIPGVVVEKY